MTNSSPRKSFFRFPDSSVFSEPSVWVLIAVNLIPLLGVFFLNWDLFSLMVLYWMETAMIGFYQLFKILFTIPILAIFLIPFFTFHFGMFMYVHFIFLSSFFGPPWVKALRDSVPAILERLLFQERFWIPALALFISHGVSFFFHGLNHPAPLPKPEVPMASSSSSYHSTDDWQSTIESTPLQPLTPMNEKTLEPGPGISDENLMKFPSVARDAAGNLMAEPYKRVFIMHITIIFGGILAISLKTSHAAMVIMIALKISADLFSHANYHRLGIQSQSPRGL